MGRFNLALDSAYVVQAMRLSPQNADRVKLKLSLSVAVIVLHLLGLFGGWPGAYLGQRWFRHKSSKISFQVLFWLIVGLYQTVALDALLGWPLLSHVRP